MGVEVCSEIPSLVVSPRISFSHDLKEADSIPVESHHRRSDELLLESIDFNFNFLNSTSSSSNSNRRFQQELLPMSSADELFADGKILPFEIKKKPSRELLESKPISASLRRNFNPPPLSSPSSSKPNNSSSRIADHYQNTNVEETGKKSLKEFLSINSDDAEDEEEDQEVKKPPTLPPPPSPPPPPSSSNKPFWQQFRRSSSLNFDNCRANNLIRSLHFLSRSNSTGSTPNPNPKPSSSSSVATKVHHQKEPSSIKRTNSSSSTQYNYYSYKSPSLRKNNNHSNGGGGHGIRITPVLHIPHACISRNSVLLGFSSLFCNGSKSKKKKKSL